MQFQTYPELITHIFALESMRDYSLEKVKKGAEMLGNPQNACKVIHITGTNGKGSVANMCFAILSQRKKKVGIFTSPHLVDIKERFRTNEGLISESDFLRIANKVLNTGLNFSYFEVCTLMAFVYFQEQKCEYAIIEVGFGGLLDSTNIVQPSITCITNIGYDHQQYLGWTLEEIAFQKAGIIKQGIPVVINTHNTVIEENANEKKSPIIFAQKERSTNLLGDHQKRNAALAYEITKYLGVDESIILYGLQQVKHRGRAEFLSKNLLIDGAHNEDGIRTLKILVNQYKHNFKKVVYCFSLKVGKKTQLVIDIVGSDQEYFVVQEKKPILADPEDLVSQMQGIKVDIASPGEIRNLARENEEILYVVFGSLYMIGSFYQQ